jgi:hypothetical protein
MLITGAFALAALLVLARIAKKRRGRKYGDSKQAFEERLRKTGAQTRDHALSAGVAEQMLPIAAAIRELLDLAGNPPGFALLEEGRTVRLKSPAGEIRIDFGLSPHLRTAPAHKTGHPQGSWRVSGPETGRQEYLELADAVAHLKRVIPGGRVLRDEGSGPLPQ